MTDSSGAGLSPAFRFLLSDLLTIKPVVLPRTGYRPATCQGHHQKSLRNHTDGELLEEYTMTPFFFLQIFFEDFIFRERGRKGERVRNISVQEKHQLVASCTPPTEALVCNPGMCPDWESNQ